MLTFHHFSPSQVLVLRLPVCEGKIQQNFIADVREAGSLREPGIVNVGIWEEGGGAHPMRSVEGGTSTGTRGTDGKEGG